MASAWVRRVALRSGAVRWRVVYRLGGREAPRLYAGSFQTAREARARRDAVAGMLATRTVPDLRSLEVTVTRPPTLAEACERWRGSRRDVTEGTRVLHRVALSRALPVLGSKHVDELTVADMDTLVQVLAAAGKRRETIKKTLKYVAAVLDEQGLAENPARSKRIRLPFEEPVEIEPPEAGHVEAVYHLLASSYRLPLLWLDWSGARVGSVETTTVDDYDEPRRRVKLRAATQKTRKALWVDLPDVLADAIERALPPREDRVSTAPLFPGVTADRLRTAIARAWKASAVPVFSPHDLRHRRISLLHRQGRSWAEIGLMVGQRKLSTTADTYTHVVVDGELDYEGMLR